VSSSSRTRITKKQSLCPYRRMTRVVVNHIFDSFDAMTMPPTENCTPVPIITDYSINSGQLPNDINLSAYRLSYRIMHTQWRVRITFRCSLYLHDLYLRIRTLWLAHVCETISNLRIECPCPEGDCSSAVAFGRTCPRARRECCSEAARSFAAGSSSKPQ